MSGDVGSHFGILSVGSNIDPLHYIPLALSHLQARCQVLASSTFYQTEPIGPTPQPPFVNGIWLFTTDLEAHALKPALLAPIETACNRQRCTDKYAPRSLDLDLILYDDHHCHDAELSLPHPDLQRSFVHGPLAELLDHTPPLLPPHLQHHWTRQLPPHIPALAIGHALKDLTESLRYALTHHP